MVHSRLRFPARENYCFRCAFDVSLTIGTAGQNGKPPDPQPAPEPVALKQPLAFGLEDGTPVKLKLNRTISSADAHVNDTVISAAC